MTSWNNNMYAHYEKQDWKNIPSLFAQEVLPYFPSLGKILEIGAGLGQDSRFFADNGFEIISTDYAEDAMRLNKEMSQNYFGNGKYQVSLLDVLSGIPFPDECFDGFYAHLSLHYFSRTDTIKIHNEIRRVLKPSGVLAVLLNTIEDKEFGIGEKIEEDYFEIRGVKKRYFSVETAKAIFGEGYDILIADSQGETYKAKALGVHNLIRFIGKKI